MYKIFYTTVSNIDTETRQPIDDTLILSKESDDDTMTEEHTIVSKWDLDDWNQMQVRTKQLALKEINDDYEAKVNELTKDTPVSERSTWVEQKAEALAYTLDNTANTPLLDRISTIRGIDKAYLATKVLEKAALYSEAIGTLTGERQKSETDILLAN